MKYIITFFLSIGYAKNTMSQTSIMHTQDNCLSVLSYNKTIIDENDLKFVLCFKNCSNTEINVTEKFLIASSNSCIADFIYEYEYISSDTTCSVIFRPPFECPFGKISELSKRLLPGDTVVFSAVLSPRFFLNKGVYKVRFLSNESIRENKLPICYTEWYEIYVVNGFCPISFPPKMND